MLQIKNISKQYKTGDLIQNALSDVSLNLRDNEFVSILGPSGSGKTTLLNIIGGLDRYDCGDLIINNVSTEHYKDRDWDSYRNHTIGFVFQSYNLIPHQTVLANVELALTIGGVSKKERKRRALDALEQVGLRDQAHKKPNQMSGGQMQRVAIARALVNNPDILLADEPTGALDTETSVQVMELLKEVAKDHLVIMVTHNPELAEAYSTRIVNLKDGKIVGDSNPYEPELNVMQPPKHKNLGKSSMSVFTALSLSFNNLLTKKGRTLLTAFAGSIGIIGIALILSLSTGFQNYIDQIQEETLTSYPLTITSETADMASMLLSMSTKTDEGTGGDSVTERQYLSTMLSKIGKNDLKAFKKHLEKESDKVDDMASLIQYQYNIKPVVFTKGTDGTIKQLNPSTMMTAMMGSSGTSTMMMGAQTSVFFEMVDSPEMLNKQYDVLAGRWPGKYNEVIIVLPEPNGISDLLLYGLELRDSKEFLDMMSKLMAGETVAEPGEPLKFTYEELMALQLKLVDATDMYQYNESYGVYESMAADTSYMQNVYDNATDLKVVGVVCAKDGATMTSYTSGVAYTKELTEHVIAKAEKSEIVQKQLANPEIDVFSNKRFDDDSQKTGLNFQDMITVDRDMLAEAFGGNVSESDINALTQKYMAEISNSITADASKAKTAYINTLATMATNMLNNYIADNKNDMLGGVAIIKMGDVDKVVSDFMATDTAKSLLAELEKEYVIPQATFATMYQETLKGMLQGYIVMAGGIQLPGIPNDPNDPSAILSPELVESYVPQVLSQEAIDTAAGTIAVKMTEAVMQKQILTKVGEMTGSLMGMLSDSVKIDEEKIAAAFRFNLSEEELTRLMQTMSASGMEKNANTNLSTLGYQDLEEPSMISFYFHDFDSKEAFIDFLTDYNEKMEEKDDDKVIKYTDLTGLMVSSVKTIVDAVSYVLIAFVSISLVVSSIMIGIITYISVFERTKEIGVLRAIGASKRNISSIFNAETFIVGLCAGALGIGVTLLLLIPINAIIHALTDDIGITAVLPVEGAIILVILSVILTLIGGLIPSKKAAKKDPVLALRSE